MPRAFPHLTRTQAGRYAAVVLMGLAARVVATHAVGARPAHTHRVCRTVTEHRRVARHAAPLLSGVVAGVGTRTVRVRVCRMVVVHTHRLGHARLVGHLAPNPVVHITTATLSAVQLTIPRLVPHSAAISLGVSLASSPFDRMSELSSYTAMVGHGPHELMWYRQWNEPLVSGTEIQQTAQRGITQLAQTIPARFPAVAGLVWFQRNKETDWRVNSSAGALGAFQALAANPDWGGPAIGVHPPG